mgnify:CR=1 FL=1
MPFTNQTEEKQIERAVLVGLSCPSFNTDQDADERTMDELRALAETAGAEAVAMTLQRRPAPDARTFIGEGKAEEVKQLAEMNDASLILFDNELSPSQMSNLEELTGRTVLDRSALILDIFAQRARTGEGKLQVELAQYQYILPRLAGMGKAMSRLGGGIGTRGPGETKLETDRRHIRERITRLQAELDEVRRVRATQRERRVKNSMPVVALVGYTNAGKSTLLNALTGAGIPANDRLFDTLDTTTRRLKVSDHLEILLSDTVGFIAKLPHHLIEAFQATLEELQYADLLLHVIDASDPHREAHIGVVDRLIDKLAKPGVPVLRCYNKADLVGDVSNLPIGEKNIPMCARSGIGMDELLTRIEETLTGQLHRAVFLLPYSDAGALAQLHEQAQVLRVDYLPEGVEVEAVCREELFGRLKRFVKEPEA